jgi:Ca-activated chloride channel family protein
MHFEQPWALLLLGLVPPLLWLRLRPPADAALRFVSAEPAASLGITLRARLASLPYWLRVAALCLFVVALARPQSGGERRRETGRGIGIYFVIDRSPSMLEAIAFGGRQTTRLAVAKQLLQEFATGDGGELKGRTSDPIGIVAFARQPETVCPLTFAHDSFAALLSGVQPPPRGDPEAFTAIGDAVALAAARLKNTPGANLRSKVIILLTDGENTAGARSPVEGAQLAARWGIRVHAIAIVGARPAPSSAAPVQYGMQMRFIAERDLNQMAAVSGGIYRSAQDGEALKRIYAEIDRLEKGEVARTKFTGGTEQFAVPLGAALGLLMSASILSATWLRRIP